MNESWRELKSNGLYPTKDNIISKRIRVEGEKEKMWVGFESGGVRFRYERELPVIISARQCNWVNFGV
jgi:hypothetical protein